MKFKFKNLRTAENGNIFLSVGICADDSNEIVWRDNVMVESRPEFIDLRRAILRNWQYMAMRTWKFDRFSPDKDEMPFRLINFYKANGKYWHTVLSWVDRDVRAVRDLNGNKKVIFRNLEPENFNRLTLITTDKF